MIVEFRISKPDFMDAGNKFGWGEKYGPVGIGLAKKRLKGKNFTTNDFIRNTDRKGCVIRAPISRLRDWYQDYKDSQMSINGTDLIIFPKSLFDYDGKPKPPKKQVQQMSLI